MKVVPRGLLQINHLRSAYPFQTQPCVSIPDNGINAVMGNAVALDGVTVDPPAGCLYAKPLFVPHDQTAAIYTGFAGVVDDDRYLNPDLPDWSWDSITVTGAHGKIQSHVAPHWGHQVQNVVWADKSAPTGFSATYLKEDISVQGFLVFLSRTVYSRVPNDQESYYELQFTINSVVYSLKVGNAEYAKFRTSEDAGTTWKDVQCSLKSGSGVVETMGNSTPRAGHQPILLEVFLINDTLTVKLGSQQAPLQFRIDDPGDPPVITDLTFVVSYFTQAQVEIHPLKFAAQGEMVSNPLAVGFSPVTDPYYFVTGIAGVQRLNDGDTWDVDFPVDSSITISRVGLSSDPEQQYDLQLTNAVTGTYAGIDYADYTVAVTRVVLHVDGIWSVVPVAPVNLVPRALQETTTFDPVHLTIRQRVRFTMDNIHANWAGQAGNLAVQLSLGYAQPATGLFPRFTGMCGNYCFQRPAQNVATCDFECTDLMKMLEDQILWTPPLMDGWNHYYAMRFLANYAGISDDQLAFLDLVPSDPFNASGFDPAPYFLPLGDGMRPWTPRNREAPVLQIMDYIRKPTAYLLFFDAQGYLRYEPWIPPSLTAGKRLFTGDPTGVNGANLTEYFGLTLTSSIEDVRNQIILLGIDPYDPRWRLIVNKLEDTASIFAAPGSEPLNYIGYKKPFVWTDPRFADPDFAAEAALRLYQIMRLPGLEVDFECWMQPDLYPMDVIYINEPTSGTEGVPFYVLSVSNRWAFEGSTQVCRTTIHGKFLL